MSSPRQLVSDSSPLRISPDSKFNMKSWSLGRRSGKKEKNRSSTSPETSPRPKSMVMSIPSASSGAEISSSVQASPSITFSSSSRGFVGDQKEDVEEHDGSASRYLSSAQQKDKVRRNKSITSTKPPLTSKNNNSHGAEERVRKTSIPSLIRSPIAASPSPSTALVSPAAAIIGGQAHEDDPFIDETASDSLSTPPSPSPRPAALSPLAVNHLTNMPIRTSEKPVSKDVLHDHQTKVTTTISTFTPSTKSASSNEMTRTKSKDEDNHETALASLRRFKGVEGYGLIDKAKMTNMDSMTVKETSNEQHQQEVKEQQQQSKESETEQPKYAFAVRKGRSTAVVKSQGILSKQKAKPVEAKYDLAIVRQSALSWSFKQPNSQTQMAVRRLIATPIPSVFGCDRAALWTVERLSRLTSCFIDVFGT